MYTYFEDPDGTVITYWLTTKDPTVPGKKRWVYGLGAEMTSKDGSISRETVDNVFCIKEEAEAFLKLLSENGVEPCHLADVAHDYIIS